MNQRIDNTDVLVLQYGQLAMDYVNSPSQEIRDRLIGLEKNIGMTREQIMKRALELVQKFFK